jgi:hypothetical protein
MAMLKMYHAARVSTGDSPHSGRICNSFSQEMRKPLSDNELTPDFTNFTDKEDLSTQSRHGAKTPSRKERYALWVLAFALRTPLENMLRSCGARAAR